MALNDQHYQLFSLPELPEPVVREFPTLPIDPYNEAGFRHRRFSQYRLDRAGGWHIELLPARPFCQPTQYNGVTGGMLRSFEPLRIDAAPLVRAGAAEISLDPEVDWQVDVHQWRVITNDHTRGVSVPEGPHQDGHTYSMIAVVDRFNIDGGETQLMPMDSDEPFMTVVLQAGQAIVLDDRRMRHYATDIVAPGGEEGHRDLFLLAYNAWADRRYGEEYEQAVLAGTHRDG